MQHLPLAVPTRNDYFANSSTHSPLSVRYLLAFFAVFFIYLFSLNTVHAQSQNKQHFNAEFLKQYEGKEIWTKVNGQSLDKNKDFIKMLEATFPKAAIKHLLNGWGPAKFEQPTMVSGPIGRDGNLMSIVVCKPHFCPDDFVEVYIDLDTMTAQGMVSINDNAKWYTPGSKSFTVKGFGGCAGDFKCARKIMSSISNMK